MTEPLPRWAWRARNHCPHPYRFGVYGDLISATPGHRRLYCPRCGRYLDGPVSLANATVGGGAA